VANPAAAPARKVHFWPFISLWDNGAGRRQWQVFSPFEVFFPTSAEMRESWTSLFAIARYDRRGPDDERGSLFWGLLKWERHPRDGRVSTVWRPFGLKFPSRRSTVSTARR
jgi:hypothetical protein